MELDIDFFYSVFSSSVTTSAVIILWLCLLCRTIGGLAFSVSRKDPKSLHSAYIVEPIRCHLVEETGIELKTSYSHTMLNLLILLKF